MEQVSDQTSQTRFDRNGWTCLADDVKGSECESDVHGGQDLDQPLDDCHDSLWIGIMLGRAEYEVEVQGLLGRGNEAGIEERGIESSVEPIGNCLRTGPPEVSIECTANGRRGLLVWQRRRDK